MSSTSPLMKLKVADLRAQLESRGLDSKGTKPTLVARLQEAMDADEKEEGPETDEKSEEVLQTVKKTILDQVAAETDSPAGSRPGTPTRKSRRVSGNFVEERPETPTRKSRRLSETVTEARPETPTRKSRRLSGNLVEDRPETPTRKSRRLSGGFEPTEERPLTPSRKSRRLSGAGEEDKPESVKNLLLEDQLAGLGSPNRRPSATARNKRISQLGGAAITTIPEIPEKEAPIVEEPENVKEIEAPMVEEPEPVKEIESHIVEEQETVKEKSEPEVAKIQEIIKDDAKNMSEKNKENNTEDISKKSVVKGKENLPLPKVLEKMIVSKQIPRQKPKSGKFWKEGRQQFRQIKRDRGQRFTFEQRLKMKEEKIKNKELAALLLNRKNIKKEEMRKKIEDNKNKKSENEKKSEHFQVIKNPSKIKRMKKKQLRMLEKRDLLAAQ